MDGATRPKCENGVTVRDRDRSSKYFNPVQWLLGRTFMSGLRTKKLIKQETLALARREMIRPQAARR